MIGRTLKAEVTIAGRKAYEVAAGAGISPRKLSDIFAGRIEPSADTVTRIRRAIWGSHIRHVVVISSCGPSDDESQ